MEKPADRVGDGDDYPPAEKPGWAQKHRLLLFGDFGALVICAGLAYGIYYLAVGRYFASTDDAYLQADATTISPQISGYVSDLLVDDNQMVTRGQVLARIDPRSYQAAVDDASAAVASAAAQVRNFDAQIDLQTSQIQQAMADVAAAQAALSFAGEHRQRFDTLNRLGTASVEQAHQADTNLETARATLVRNAAAHGAAEKQLAVLNSQKEMAAAALARAQAALEQARINFGFTDIVAPVDGAIGDRTARPGIFVQPGTKLMSVVPMGRKIYVVANFKETDLNGVYRGQHADIAVDAFAGATLRGTVDSLAPGSGSQFSLLPPENATGNFTKIVQRVPVKILLEFDGDLLEQIRPGLSVEVSVDIRTTPPGPRTTLAEAAR